MICVQYLWKDRRLSNLQSNLYDQIAYSQGIRGLQNRRMISLAVRQQPTEICDKLNIPQVEMRINTDITIGICSRLGSGSFEFLCILMPFWIRQGKPLLESITINSVPVAALYILRKGSEDCICVLQEMDLRGECHVVLGYSCGYGQEAIVFPLCFRIAL